MELTIEQAMHQGVTAHKSGNSQEAERIYHAILRSQPKHPDANHNLGLIAISVNQIGDALSFFKTALDVNPNIEQFWLSYVDALVKAKRVKDAKRTVKKAKKKGFDTKKIQALLLQAQGVSDIKGPSKERVDSQFEHYKSGRLSHAEKLALATAQEFPQHGKSWELLGTIFLQTGRQPEALNAFQIAVGLCPLDAQSHSNLGVALEAVGKISDAAIRYMQALKLNPDLTVARTNLCIILPYTKFNASYPQYDQILMDLLTKANYVSPKTIAPSILSLLEHDPLIKSLQLEKKISTDIKKVNGMVRSLDELTLLTSLMRTIPLPDLQFEKLFVAMRRFVLTNLDQLKTSSELINFLSTLSLHCFVNEYVYAESDEEFCLIKELENKIMQTITQSEQPKAINLLCLASYRPLHQYNWCQNLEALDNLKEVKVRLIEEPLAEKVIAQNIPLLGEISDDVSLKVREQYEENPYPRWVKTGIMVKAQSISRVCDDSNLHLHSENIKNVAAPAVLIAGCGTGQQSISTASRFSKCHVTAIDLSRASLAYAQRKSNELGFTNIDYMQADILHLHQMDKKFDIIESVGVLHHMEEPMAGWRVLMDILKPGGLMKIGLYSELARGEIVNARREIASLGIGTSATEIRNFRKSIIESENKRLQKLYVLGDFYSLSEFRDLVFHVQEHRFTLPQIKNCLYEMGLKFCGFEHKELNSNFREFHGEEVDMCDLALWHEFEENYPDSFIGMYQFWCQRL
tara:strand:- start:111 stop:2345 length:2235 start_codon:yes stop_codon:yes gene_type:complete